MMLVSTSSSARLNLPARRREMLLSSQKVSTCAAMRATFDRSSDGMTMESPSFSIATAPTDPDCMSVLEAHADSLHVSLGTRGQARRQAADHDRAEPGELAVVGQELVVARCGGIGDQRAALVLDHHIEPVFIELHRHARLLAGRNQQRQALRHLDHRALHTLYHVAAGAPDAA